MNGVCPMIKHSRTTWDRCLLDILEDVVSVIIDDAPVPTPI